MNKKYDLIFSLGGSCASAHNLRKRHLRFCSFPLDWCFFADESVLSNLNKCFQEDFKNFFLQENLVELNEDEKGDDGGGHIQYKDIYTGYRFIHVFDKPATDTKYYQKIKNIVDKRIKRLYKQLKKAQKVLLLLDTNFEVKYEILENLIKTIKEKFDIAEVSVYWLELNSKTNNVIEINNVTHAQTTRDYNDYDAQVGTNWEWAFLDEIKIDRHLKEIVDIHRIKKGVLINILGCINTLFNIEIYFLGFRFQFCLGRNRDVFKHCF